MRTALAFAVSALLSISDAIELVKRSSPAVVRMPIERKPYRDPRINYSKPAPRDTSRKRQTNTISVELANEQTLYFADVDLGTPAQTLRLHIDTGSSDLWTNTAASALCQAHHDQCSAEGTYSANSSSSYKYINSQFNISYVDGSGAIGDYATDNLVIGGDTLDALQFGIGYTSSSVEGILGIGYPANEAQANSAQPYANVPAFMQQSGLINAAAYSLWLNDLDSNTGSILFGGVDTDKYTGSLESLPIIPENGVYSEFIIALTAIGINGDPSGVVSDQAIPVLLDSGSSLMYLPDNITDILLLQYHAQYSTTIGAAIVDCNLANQAGSVDFTFSSPTISVPLRELVLFGGYQNGEPYCLFGVSRAGASTSVLGDTFLRSAYVVYGKCHSTAWRFNAISALNATNLHRADIIADLSNNQISLANTIYNSTSSNIMEISPSSTGVPGATQVTNAVTSVAVQSGGAILGNNGGSFTITVSGSAAAAPMATPAPARAFGALALAGLGAMLAV